MKVVQITGSRSLPDYLPHCHSLMAERLDREAPDLLICGMASGADTIAYLWAIDRGCPVEEFRADWHRHGKAAGPIRNQQMVDRSVQLRDEGHEVVVLGWMVDGSRGTADMIRRCKAAGLHGSVIHIEKRGEC